MTFLSMTCAVEGLVDEAVAKKLIHTYAGIENIMVYGQKGKEFLRSRVTGYNHAARYQPWLVLVDMDYDDCAPSLLREWLPDPAPHMLFRVAVREIESWLMADRSKIADYLGVSLDRIPMAPDNELDPKQCLLNIIRQSRKRTLKKEMLPSTKSSQLVGQAYDYHLIKYVREAWRPQEARKYSESLDRCISNLESLK